MSKFTAAKAGLGAAAKGTKGFILKGLKGQDIRGLKNAATSGKMQGRWVKAYRKGELTRGMKGLGRSAAVYGGGATALGGGAVGIKKMRKEDIFSPLEREALQEAIVEALLDAEA
jgi:hypothetical protein